jgi:hypothetical protein
MTTSVINGDIRNLDFVKSYSRIRHPHH